MQVFIITFMGGSARPKKHSISIFSVRFLDVFVPESSSRSQAASKQGSIKYYGQFGFRNNYLLPHSVRSALDAVYPWLGYCDDKLRRSPWWLTVG